MFAEDTQFRDFQGERLRRFASLIPQRSGDGLLILCDGEDRVLKAHHTSSGRVDPESLKATALDDLAPLAESEKVGWIVLASTSALASLNEAASAALKPGGDLVDVGICMARAAVEEARAGGIRYWPDLFEGLELPSRTVLDRVFDTLFTPETTALLYIFDGSELYTEGIVLRGKTDIEAIVGHEALAAGPPPKRWREDYKEILKQAEKKLGAPSLGVFVSLDAAQSILAGKRPGELARAMARKDLIIDPLPFWLAGPIGAVAVRDAVSVGRRASAQIAERLDGGGLGGRLAKKGGKLAGRLAGRMKGKLAGKLKEATPLRKVGRKVEDLRKQADLQELLGFDPFKIGTRLMKIWQGGERPDSWQRRASSSVTTSATKALSRELVRRG